MESFLSKNEEDTIRIAQKVARSLAEGDVLALVGDLGSGKTTFVKGLASALGVSKTVTSPTFVIMKNYPLPNEVQLVHVDCYRLSSPEDAKSIGLADYFSDRKSIIVLEWPEKIKEILPSRTKYIKFEYISETTRRITI